MTDKQKEVISILNRLKETWDSDKGDYDISEEEYFLLMDFVVPDKKEIPTYPTINMPTLKTEEWHSEATTAVSYDGDLSVTQAVVDEQPTIPSILDLKLEDSRLSVRTLNCLKLADIRTVGDLIKCTRTDILKIRNLGRNTLAEIDDFLDVFGLKLKSKEE